MPQTEYSFRGSESKQGIQFQYKESSSQQFATPNTSLNLVACLTNFMSPSRFSLLNSQPFPLSMTTQPHPPPNNLSQTLLLIKNNN